MVPFNIPVTVPVPAGKAVVVAAPDLHEAHAALKEPALAPEVAQVAANAGAAPLALAVLNGLGIGVLPDYVVHDFPELERVLPALESKEIPVFLAYPEELRHSKRVSAFRDFVVQEIHDYRRRAGA